MLKTINTFLRKLRKGNINNYSENIYNDKSLTKELVLSVEKELGYKLPSSYIKLMKTLNGKEPSKKCFYTEENLSRSDSHISITRFKKIGFKEEYSLCGELGSKFFIENWGYPDIGIYICDCPSGGHDMVMLDYTKCGAEGEPEVMHIDQESNYEKTFLAKDFKTFVDGLINCELLDEDFNLYAEEIILKAKFPPKLESFLKDFKKNEDRVYFAIKNIVYTLDYNGVDFDFQKSPKTTHLFYSIISLLVFNRYKISDKMELQACLQRLFFSKSNDSDSESEWATFHLWGYKDWCKKRNIQKMLSMDNLNNFHTNVLSRHVTENLNYWYVLSDKTKSKILNKH